MKRFMLLHFGFEIPTPEIMEASGNWFGSVADKTVDHGNPSIASIRIYEISEHQACPR
jgi:hypothetical protein